tara:strand:+ start:10412 stop:11236 length:825 start_codon:yes stop_codon:yes gene_type:complete
MIKKVINNILNLKVVKSLGIFNYIIFLTSVMKNLIEIIKQRNMNLLDKEIGRKDIFSSFNFKNHQIKFDCNYTDKLILEDSFSFGIIREIIIRNAYFIHLPSNAYENCKVIVDLGANRGCFSTLMTPVAEKILTVEVLNKYNKSISHNLELNNFHNYAVENSYVGGEGADVNNANSFMSIDELFNKYKVDFCDIIKIDIEGSEFKLFQDLTCDWLSRVNYIVMEVHQKYGDPKVILERLTSEGFNFNLANENLTKIKSKNNFKSINYIYAWKNK